MKGLKQRLIRRKQWFWSRNSIVELGGKFLINPGSVTGACSELGICVVSHERKDVTVSMVGLCSTKAMQWESLTSRDSLNAKMSWLQRRSQLQRTHQNWARWARQGWIKRTVYCLYLTMNGSGLSSLMDALAEAILHAHGCSRKIGFMTAGLCKTFQDFKLTCLNRSLMEAFFKYLKN